MWWCSFSRHVALAAVLGLLSACGFHLRGEFNVPFASVYVATTGASQVANVLKRELGNSPTKLMPSAKDAEAQLNISAEKRERIILSLSGAGRVREYQLRYRVSYRVADKDNKELRAPTQILLHRDFSFNDTDTLSKESEEALLYRDMQTDAVNQLLRQLQTARATAATL